VLVRYYGEYKFKLRMRGGNGQCAGVLWRISKVSQRKIIGELFHRLAEIILITGTVSPTGRSGLEVRTPRSSEPESVRLTAKLPAAS
jgi:hypothetical protein